MGTREIGSCQPISMADGIRTKKEMTTPLTGPLSGRFELAIKKPETTHNKKAERLASQVSP